jgi:hypothetical protein
MHKEWVIRSDISYQGCLGDNAGLNFMDGRSYVGTLWTAINFV